MSARFGALLVLSGCALFGTVGTARALGPDASELQVAFVRVTASALVLTLFALGARSPTISRRAWHAAPVWGAGVSQAVFQVSIFEAFSRVGVASGTLISIGLAPLITGLLARAFSWAWASTTAMGLGGLALLVGGIEVSRPSGIGFALLAATSYAVYLLCSAATAARGIALESALAAIFSISAIVLLPALLVGDFGWLAQPRGITMMAFLVLVPTVLSYRLLNSGLAAVPAASAATLALIEPVVAALLAVLVLGERLPPPATLGAALILAAVFVLVRVQGRATARTAESVL